MRRMQNVTVDAKKKRTSGNEQRHKVDIVMPVARDYLDFAISRAALMRGDKVRRGSHSLKKGCCVDLSMRQSRPRKWTHFEKLGCCGPLFGVDLQRLGQVVLEYRGQRLWVGDGGRAIRSNQIQGFQWVLVEIRGFTLDHLWKRNETNVWHQTSDLPIAMIPRLHISTFGPYSLRVTTSGAIQYGVPTMVVRFELLGSDICAQKPKSAT